MSDRLGAALAATIDPDRLLTFDECSEIFGLPAGTYETAAKAGELNASGARGIATRVRADDARAFTSHWHNTHPIKTR